MPLNGTNTVRKKNHINSINHKIVRNCAEPPSAGQNHQEPNQSNVLTPAIHDLNVVWFQFFTITRKVQFVRNK